MRQHISHKFSFWVLLCLMLSRQIAIAQVSEENLDRLRQLTADAATAIQNTKDEGRALKTLLQLKKLAKELDVAEFLGESFYFEAELLTQQGKRTEAIEAYIMAVQYFNEAKKSAGMAKSNYGLAYLYFENDNYNAAIMRASAALSQSRNTMNQVLQSATLALMCDIFTYLGRYEDAILHCIEALEIQDSMGITEQLPVTLNAIGSIYRESGSVEKAEQYFFRALELAENTQDQYGIATTLSNLGNLYLDIDRNAEKALKFFNRALELDSLQNDQWGLAYSNHDLAKAYNQLGEHQRAIEYLLIARAIAEEEQMPEHLANIYIELANSYSGMGQYQRAIGELKKALTIAQRINAASLLKTIYRTLSRNYDRINDKDNALVYMRLYTMQIEKMYREESARAIAEAEALYELNKKEKEISLLRKEGEIIALQSKQQRLTNYALGMTLFMFLVLLIIMNNRIRYRKEVNEALQEKNAAINQQTEEILAQRDHILNKNQVLSEKNRQITNSMFYARQIQQSLLPDLKAFKQLWPQSFIFFRPRDIVSGDFFWYAELDDSIAVAVIDCTGHGVPGAFMTILTNSLLNQIIVESGIHSPDLVLSLLDQKLKQNLHQNDPANESTDGLEIGLCFIQKNSYHISYAGASIPLYFFNEKSEIKTLKADRQWAGGSLMGDKVFTKKEIQLQKGDHIYLATDGFQDQFGGEYGQKFMKARFKNLLIGIHIKPISEQEEIITHSFQQWRKNSQQTDDILILGMKL
jgi:serine phosphatase RsbU (regulator of sigma subunit)